MTILVKLFVTGIVLMLFSSFVGAFSVMVEDSRICHILSKGALIGLAVSILLVCGSVLGMIWS